MVTKNEGLIHLGTLAKQAAAQLATASSEAKNHALLAMAAALEKGSDKILAANALDMAAEREKGQPAAILDRLLLTQDRIADMADGLRSLAALEDPIGKVDKMWYGAQHIQIGKMRVPLGVVGVIYEARPNVTSDVAGICLKTGNAVILRGSASAIHSNQVIVALLETATVMAGLPEGCIQLLTDTSRETAAQFMRMNEYIDVLIPRGGAGLIRSVVEGATVPVIETGTGNCHIFVDESADLAMAEAIVLNAKCQRPGVCNAMETLLVHKAVAAKFLPQIGAAFKQKGVEIRGDMETCRYIVEAKKATEEDYATEFLDLILAVKTVSSLEEAIAHINRYGTGHSEAIITQNYQNSRIFQQQVDAAAVYVNASTRFTDGFQFGFGAEIGISTQKLHARGPMGLEEMTTCKYIVMGEGQIRANVNR